MNGEKKLRSLLNKTKSMNFKILEILINNDIIKNLKYLTKNKHIYMKIVRFFNLYSSKTPGRLYIDYSIIPKLYNYCREDDGAVLIIGFRRYVAHYIPYFLENKLYIIDPALNPLPFKHKNLTYIKDYLENVYEQFKNKNLELIHFVGVYGWGIDTAKDLTNILEIFYNIMDKDTLLLFGYNIYTNNPLDIHNNYEKYFYNFQMIDLGDNKFNLNTGVKVFKKVIK